MKFQLKSILAIATLSVLISGCATPTGADRAAKIEQNLKDGRTSLATAKTTINSTLTNLNAMQQEGADLKTLYATLVENVATITDMSQRLKTGSRNFKTLYKQRYDAWKMSLNQITDEDLRDDSRERMEDQMEKYEDFFELLNDAETIMDPLATKLANIKKFLDLDLTPASVEGVAKYIDRANSNAEDVIEWIDDVTEEINDIVGLPPVPVAE